MSSRRVVKPVKTTYAENIMNINGGKSQISRVFSNLLANAWDSLGENGIVEIKTENYYIDASKTRYGMIPKGEYVKVTISDNGCGIPVDIRPKIFDPFFTTKKADISRGSGLGLSVVHAVVEDHEGYVDIESVVGEGSSFYLYFPITRDDVIDKVIETIEGGTESILVVDDDSTQMEIASVLLGNLGYEVVAIESGVEAVSLLQTRSFDLMILDMIMPESIDGAETYRRALAINSDQKALIVSGYAETDRVKEALDLGAGAYIRKPLTMKTIAKAVRKELNRTQNNQVSRPKKLQTT